MTAAETITTETVAERGTGTTTGGTETAAPTTVMAAAGVGAAIALGPDHVRPVTVAALTAESASSAETRAATVAGANLAGDPATAAAVALRPAHLPSLSQAFCSMALRGDRRLGALPRPSLHIRDKCLLVRESLLLPRLQWHRPFLPLLWSAATSWVGGSARSSESLLYRCTLRTDPRSPTPTTCYRNWNSGR